MATETTADILREMREFADTDSQDIGRDVLRRKIQHFVERIEAAHERELDDALTVGAFVAEAHEREVDVSKTETTIIESTCKEPLSVESVTNRNGLNTNPAENVNSEKVIYNGAKLRNALKRCVKMLDICLLYSHEGYPGQNDDIKETMAKAEAALRMPRRNCDVGTAEEQEERFKNFCQSYYEPCNVDGECWRCPLFKTKTRCSIAWSQMPYEKGENNEQKQS